MSEVLDLLLAGTVRNVQKEPETAEIEIPRLSKLCGKPVVFRLRSIGFDQIREAADHRDQYDQTIVLAGTVEPNLHDVRLAAKFGLLAQGEKWGDHGVLPTDLTSAMLLPGELSELRQHIERLSGYLKDTTKVIKKN